MVNPNSIGPRTQYLGNKVSHVTLDNGQNAGIFSSFHYVQNDVKKFIDKLAQKGRTIPKCGKSPWNINYRPETDTSTEIPARRSSYYQSMIGVIWWITEFGRVDITMEKLAMDSMLAM